jgi:hypothetical protein
MSRLQKRCSRRQQAIRRVEKKTVLLERRGYNVQITAGVMKAAAKNKSSGVMTLLLDRMNKQTSSS